MQILVKIVIIIMIPTNHLNLQCKIIEIEFYINII